MNKNRTITTEPPGSLFRDLVVHMKCSAEISPWSPATGSLRSSSVSSCVVLTDTALWVHSEANIYSTLEFRVRTVQHVHAIETLHLDHHPVFYSSSRGRLLTWRLFFYLYICSVHLAIFNNFLIYTIQHPSRAPYLKRYNSILPCFFLHLNHQNIHLFWYCGSFVSN